LNILLARWLTTRDYGAFSVCWSILLVLAAFHNALVLEPMTVVGPADFQDRLAAYFRANARLNWLVLLLLSIVCATLAMFYPNAIVRSSLLVLVICLPGYLLLLTARRREYVVNRPLRSLLLSLIYALLVFSFIAFCRSTGNLTATTGVLALGVTWFVVFWRSREKKHEEIALGQVAGAHWMYGKWVFASAILAVGASDIQTLLLSMLVDLKAAGALRALMNFVLPLSQLLTVFSIYALPRLSLSAKENGPQKLLSKAIWFPAALMMLLIFYLGLLLLFAPQFERLLYGGKMEAYVRWMPLLAGSAFAAGVGASFSTLLRAVKNSQHVFLAGITGTTVGVISAVLLQRNLGIGGALWSLLAANVCSTLVIIAIYVRSLRRTYV
jgi:O-antigen/teichoic acid export membrane protein